MAFEWNDEATQSIVEFARLYEEWTENDVLAVLKEINATPEEVARAEAVWSVDGGWGDPDAIQQAAYAGGFDSTRGLALVWCAAARQFVRQAQDSLAESPGPYVLLQLAMAGRMLASAIACAGGVVLSDPKRARKAAANEMNAVKYGRYRDLWARLPDLWKEAKAQGLKKNQAAQAIAERYSVSPTSVRDRLKGLPD